MPDGEDKKSVDERLRDIEDRLEIYNLIASHPPSADTAADYYTSAVYTEDGVFDRGEGLSGAVGNAAFVTSYLQILTPDILGDDLELPNHGSSTGFRIHRVVANRWTLARTPEGWKIRSRKLRPLDGSAPARDILELALAGYRDKI